MNVCAPVFRFAPSPNGYLHLGHALSALLNADMATAAGGRLLLRIEDIDETRCRPEYEAAIYEDLAWLGIEWEQPVRRQSEHYEIYRAALAKLDALGLIYPSFESRAEIARMAAGTRPRRRATLFRHRQRSCRRPNASGASPSGEPYALRLDMQAATARAGPLSWRRDRRRRTLRPKPATLGRCHPRAQGNADQLSSFRRGRRRRARRHRRGARARPVPRRHPCIGCCRRCLACRRRAITTTG